VYVKTNAVDVNTSRSPEEGAHSPGWPNRLIIIIIIINHIYPIARLLRRQLGDN
jgi:hypothetical protein